MAAERSRMVRGERKRKTETVRQGPRPLREDGYKREDGYMLASRPRSYGLEGRPFIARGEPHFAAEPREYGRRRIGGRAQDIATHRRSPSPQQAEHCLAGRKKTRRHASNENEWVT